MKDQVIDKKYLVTEMDKLGSIFANKLGASFDARFEPYMGYYHAMELIDPAAPAKIPDGTWERVEKCATATTFPTRTSNLRSTGCVITR